MKPSFRSFCLACFLSALPALSQSINSGTILGTVTDPSGAVVAGAMVRLQNSVTGYMQSVTADSSGAFRFNNVPQNNYRLTVDAQGVVTQVTILKAFTVTAIYDERFSNVKGTTVPALDKVMVQALMRWRAKPGPQRVVDIYWSFGTQSWLNYGKQNGSQ